MRDLAKPYPKNAEAHFAVALAAYNGGAPEGTGDTIALEEIDRALAIKPDWERAALLKSEVLARKKPDDAIVFLAQFAAANPEARGAAGALAQLYVEQKRYAEARAVFQRLWDGDRSAREFEFGVAVISMQMKDWDTAESLFQDLKRANYGDNGAVELYLAQIAEETGNYAEAIERYKAVPEGDRGWLAKLRVAAMMGKLGKVTEARKYLSDLPAVTIEQRVQVRQAEAQLLRDANDFDGAYAVLVQALKEHPDSPELLYDTAMVAETLDRVDEAEARLRRVVELKPDDAQSLNALGYTLVDRTPRVAEGLALIERAHKLSPDDPFILDSMGWAMFKLGRYAEAETLPAPRAQGAPGRRDRRAPRRSAVGEGRSRPRAGNLAVAAQDHAGQRGAARNGSPPRALMRAALAAWSIALLAACATTPPGTPPPDARAEPAFSAHGRMSARRGSDAVAVHFAWRHAPANDDFDVATPLGQIVARMRRDAAGVRVERPNEAARRLIRDWERAHANGARRAASGRRTRVVDPGRAGFARRERHRARCRGASASAAPAGLGDRVRVCRRRVGASVAARDALSRQRADRSAHRRRSLASRRDRGSRAREGQPVPARDGTPRATAITLIESLFALIDLADTVTLDVRSDGAVVRARRRRGRFPRATISRFAPRAR